MTKRKPILCLDFDGVVHCYSSGWQGPRTIPDPPVPGAIEFILTAMQTFEVNIFSSRSRYWFGRFAMTQWLFTEVARYTGDTFATAHLMKQIKFPKHKPPAMITLDDRAVTFNGAWPTMETLKAFKPWYR